jgi:ribosomal-protein-alanine N-acetyltransferase
MYLLQTERLDLSPLSITQLKLYLEQPNQLEKELGLPLSRAIMTDIVRRAITMKIEKMAHIEQTQSDWYTYWLLTIRNLHFGAGLAGFKGFPDQNGESEIGYGIDPMYQNQGYITEAVRKLIEWAFREPACHSVVAREVKKWNTASQHVMAKVGMKVYRESEDGLCYKIDQERN